MGQLEPLVISSQLHRHSRIYLPSGNRHELGRLNTQVHSQMSGTSHLTVEPRSQFDLDLKNRTCTVGSNTGTST